MVSHYVESLHIRFDDFTLLVTFAQLHTVKVNPARLQVYIIYSFVPKDSRILRMPSGVCPVTKCTQHGLFFKRLDKHLKRVHPGITMESLRNFPVPNPKDRSIKQKTSTDRHIRRPCLVPGCRYFNVAVSRLSDHLRRQHAMTVNEHEKLYKSRDACRIEGKTL